MKKLKIVLHSSNNTNPLFIELRIDDGLASALQTLKVTRAEFLVSDDTQHPVLKGLSLLDSIPDLSKLGQQPLKADLDDYHSIS